MAIQGQCEYQPLNYMINEFNEVVQMCRDFVVKKDDLNIVQEFHTLAEELVSLSQKSTPRKSANRLLINHYLLKESNEFNLDLQTKKTKLHEGIKRIQFRCCYYGGIDQHIAAVFRGFFLRNGIRTVLELGSGAGWWALAMDKSHSFPFDRLSVTATDSFEHLNFSSRKDGYEPFNKYTSMGVNSTDESRKSIIPPPFARIPELCVFPVEMFEAKAAIDKYADSHQALFMCCPTTAYVNSLALWPRGRIIVVITTIKGKQNMIGSGPNESIFEFIEDDQLNKLSIYSQLSEPLAICVIKTKKAVKKLHD